MSFLISSDGSYIKSFDGSYLASSDTVFLTVGCIDVTWIVNASHSSSFSPNGTGPYTFALIDGALPTGLSLNGVTGAVSGTPTVLGLYSITILVVDSLGAVQITTCPINVTSAPVTYSGIYHIDPAKIHDTLYTSVADPNNPTTGDFAIPNPYIESALIGDE